MLSTEKDVPLTSIDTADESSDHTCRQGALVDDSLPTWPKDPRAYVTLFGGWLLMFNSWGLVNTYGTFQSYYKVHLLHNRDTTQITLIGGTQSFCILLASFVTGRLLDAGHHRLLSVTGGVLTTFGMFMLSLCGGNGGRSEGNYLAIWLTQGLTVGLGMSCMFVMSSQVVATWFVKKRGLAVGITASGASIAGLVYPILFKYVLADYGFATAVRYFSIVVGVTSFIAVFCANPNPAAVIRVPEKWLKAEVWFDKTAFDRRPYVWFVATMCLVFLGFYPVFFNLERWAQWKHIGVKEDLAGGTGGLAGESGFRTFYFLSMSNGCSTIGRILGAYLSDHHGALDVHYFTTFLGSIFVFTFWPLTSNLASAIAFSCLFGIVSGTIIGIPPFCVASLLVESEQRRLGQWTGMMYSITAIPSLVGPVLVGVLVKRFSFMAVMVWCGTCLFLAACCTVVARVNLGYERKKIAGDDK